MNKRKAIKILELQKSKLEDKNLYKDETWVFQTASYLKDIFGEDSTEYIFISRFKFGVKVLNITPDEEVRRMLKDKKEKVSIFLDNCIETIKIKGLRTNHKANFMNRLGNGAIIGIISFVVPSLIAIGFYFGTEKINNDYIEFKAENKRITNKYDSLNSIISIQAQQIDSLILSSDSINKELFNAKSQIATYQSNHQTITVKFSEPYSLFGGLVLINAEKYYDEVRISFEGDIIASLKPEMEYKQTEISIKQGKRFYIRDNLNQDWIINILKVDSFEVKMELIKKTMP